MHTCTNLPSPCLFLVRYRAFRTRIVTPASSQPLSVIGRTIGIQLSSQESPFQFLLTRRSLIVYISAAEQFAWRLQGFPTVWIPHIERLCVSTNRANPCEFTRHFKLEGGPKPLHELAYLESVLVKIRQKHASNYL